MDITNNPSTSKDCASNTQKTKTEIGATQVKIVDPAVKALKCMKDAVYSELISCEPGDELDTLIRTLQHDVPNASQVKEDVLAAFQNYYRGIFKDGQLQLYGSVVMELAFKDSDLDFYIELPNVNQYEYRNVWNKTIRDVLKLSKKFTRFELITKATVKCTHIGTLTNCNFNCSNQFGLPITPIIAHLLKFDPRIYKLAIIIKYWTKIHDCNGKNRLSSYGVVWMLIFYLQTLPKPIVPPIDDFQRNVRPSIVSHRNFAFDYSLQNKTENQSEWPELLFGFFKFYRDFDYDSQLICPLYGKTFSKSDVMEKRVIELRRYEEILLADHNEKPMRLYTNSLCIQDPFDIVRRIPGDISSIQFRKIVSKIGYAAEIIECELQKGETKSLLLRLFDLKEFDLKEKIQDLERQLKAHQQYTEQERQIEEQKRAQLNNVEQMKLITSLRIEMLKIDRLELILKPTNFILDHSQYDVWQILTNNSNIQIDKHSIRKIWAEEVIDMIGVILRKIFCLDFRKNKNSAGFIMQGARNVFVERRKKTICAETWNEELLDSSNRFSRSSHIPLYVSGSITADIVNFDYVSIQFSNRIGSNKTNFYSEFRVTFAERIGYFLTIYFLHRIEMAKSKIADANPTKVKPTTKSSTQQKSISTLPSTPIVSQNAKNPKKTFLLTPTELMLLIISRLPSKPVSDNDNVAVKQFWADTVIEFIIQILRDIFKLKLINVKLDGFPKQFYFIGTCDVFIERTQQRPVNDNTLNLELQESIDRSMCSSELLASFVTIATDAKNFDSVSIEFNDRLTTETDNFYETFCQQFNDNILYLLDVYFVHRHKIILTSDTVYMNRLLNLNK